MYLHSPGTLKKSFLNMNMTIDQRLVVIGIVSWLTPEVLMILMYCLENSIKTVLFQIIKALKEFVNQS